jgi:hypothetical protein
MPLFLVYFRDINLTYTGTIEQAMFFTFKGLLLFCQVFVLQCVCRHGRQQRGFSVFPSEHYCIIAAG